MRPGNHSNWGFSFATGTARSDSYIHPFGASGEPWGGVEFQHHWLRALQAGHLRFFAAGRFIRRGSGARQATPSKPPNEDRKSIRATYAYVDDFDAGPYAAYRRSWATAAGRAPKRRAGVRCGAS